VFEHLGTSKELLSPSVHPTFIRRAYVLYITIHVSFFAGGSSQEVYKVCVAQFQPEPDLIGQSCDT